MMLMINFKKNGVQFLKIVVKREIDNKFQISIFQVKYVESILSNLFFVQWIGVYGYHLQLYDK